MLVGAVEEFTPHTAWAHRRLGRPGLPGEAAVFVVLEPAGRLAGRPALARLAATGAGYRPGGDAVGAGLGACVLGLLKRAEVDPGRVAAVAATEPAGTADERIRGAVVEAGLGRADVPPVPVRDALGDCGAATGALQLAVLLSGRPPAAGADAAVLAAWSPEGAFAAAVLEGCGRAGADRQ